MMEDRSDDDDYDDDDHDDDDHDDDDDEVMVMSAVSQYRARAGGWGGRGLYSHKILAATKIQTWKTFEIRRIQTLTTLWIVEQIWKYIYNTSLGALRTRLLAGAS